MWFLLQVTGLQPHCWPRLCVVKQTWRNNLAHKSTWQTHCPCTLLPSVEEKTREGMPHQDANAGSMNFLRWNWNSDMLMSRYVGVSLFLSLSLPPSIHLSSSVIYIYYIYCVIYTSPLLGDSLPALVSATVFYMGALDTSAMIFNGLLMLIKFLFLWSVSNSTGAGSFTFSTQRHA